MPGVLQYITASNIPKGGVNNFMPAGYDPEEVLMPQAKVDSHCFVFVYLFSNVTIKQLCLILNLILRWNQSFLIYYETFSSVAYFIFFVAKYFCRLEKKSPFVLNSIFLFILNPLKTKQNIGWSNFLSLACR